MSDEKSIGDELAEAIETFRKVGNKLVIDRVPRLQTLKKWNHIKASSIAQRLDCGIPLFGFRPRWIGCHCLKLFDRFGIDFHARQECRTRFA
jgi:hypothetical protein